jgi:threonine/homoserine/homoserine lactone efflux protein
MSQSWGSDAIYLLVVALLLLVTAIVYALLKKRRPREDDRVLFAKAQRWVEGVFAALLIGGLIFITFRYS